MADGLRERSALILAADGVEQVELEAPRTALHGAGAPAPSCCRSTTANEVKPSWIVSHDLPLDQAPEACRNVDARQEGWTKVVLHPGQSA
jgi:hypothetical protein